MKINKKIRHFFRYFIRLVLGFAFFSLLNLANILAEDVDQFTVSIIAGANYNQHHAGFVSLPVYTNQFQAYEDNTSMGINLGFASQYYFLPYLGLDASICYNTFGVTLSSTEFIGNQVNSKGELFPVYTHHNLETSLGSGNAKLGFALRPMPKLPLIVNFGFNYGILIKKSFVQTESLDQVALDNGFLFTDGNIKTAVRQKGDTTLPFSFDYMAAYLGLTYLQSINDNIKVGLDIKYTYNVQEIVKYTGWKVDQIGVNLVFNYSLSKETLEESEEEKIEKQRKIEENAQIEKAIEQAKRQHELDSLENLKKFELELAMKKEAELKAARDLQMQIKLQEEAKLREKARLDSIDNENAKTKASMENTGIIQGEDLLQNLSRWKCCYVILFSSNNKKTAEKKLAEINKSGINDIDIVSWYDAEDKVTYYRVRTKCFATDSEVFKFKSELLKSQNSKSLIPIVKCE